MQMAVECGDKTDGTGEREDGRKRRGRAGRLRALFKGSKALGLKSIAQVHLGHVLFHFAR